MHEISVSIFNIVTNFVLSFPHSEYSSFGVNLFSDGLGGTQLIESDCDCEDAQDHPEGEERNVEHGEGTKNHP